MPPRGQHQPDARQPDAPRPDPNPAVPLLRPAGGVPALAVSADEIARAADQLASGAGPFAVDAERASGFRYSNRAYLIQIRRTVPAPVRRIWIR